MLKDTVVINVVGLSKNLIGENTPHIQSFINHGEFHSLKPVTPAVTCTMHATFTTGEMPNKHGIVANGWYFKDLSEIWFWRQSNKLVSGEKIWDRAKERSSDFTCAKLFWWYNMYSTTDYSITPRPMYTADGRKIPDIYTHPNNLREILTEKIGRFPLFRFWGPKADIISSKWIVDAAKNVYEQYKPTLNLIYLPHLDYNLQRYGPDMEKIKEDLWNVDKLCAELIEYFTERNCNIIILSEYNIYKVTEAIHINRIFRQHGWIKTRKELGREMFDPGASDVFGVCDHQIAHIYIQNTSIKKEVKKCLESTPGIAQVLDDKEKGNFQLDHQRSGDLIALSDFDRWFSYYYWLDDKKAPDYARTVDIHRKPGYDPVELFLDPKIPFIKGKIIWKLLKKYIGFRTLLDVIPLDTSLVKGSHGRVSEDINRSPIFLTNKKGIIDKEVVLATEVKDMILRHIF